MNQSKLIWHGETEFTLMVS